MKSKEQIEMAMGLIKQLQDYVELAKVEKKLKDEANQKAVSKQLDELTTVITEDVVEL